MSKIDKETGAEGGKRGPFPPHRRGPRGGGQRRSAPSDNQAADAEGTLALGGADVPTSDAGPGRDSAARIFLHQGRARPLWFGHPWAYANAIARVEGTAQPGDVVSVLDHDGRFIGRGLFNPRSQIPVRLVSREDVPVDDAFFREKIVRAKALRARLRLPSPRTNAYRLVNSEGDGLPGLVVDVYGDAAVVQITTLGMAQRREAIFSAVEELCATKSLYEVGSQTYATLEGFTVTPRVVRGEPRMSVPCLEDGIALEVEPLSGQKTGMFLDQRENRMRVGTMAEGARVLDCYSYAGGFALQAARGGAAEVTAVDTSARAVARIEAHAAAGGLTVRAIEQDSFRFLETATPRSYDLVVIDPPKFARARKDFEAARKGYERLNALAMGACAPGALLVTCSCSQNINPTDFERIVAAGAKQAGRQVRVLGQSGAGPDHPLPPGFAEGQYLKVLFCHVE